MASKYPKGMSEKDKLALSQKRRREAREAGVVEKTPEQKRTEAASRRRQRIMPKTGLQALQDVLAPKEEEKKKRTR